MHTKNLRDGLLKIFEGRRWVALTAYALTDFRVPTKYNGYIYECTTAGTAGESEPTWGTTVGETTNDGTAVWTCRALKEVTVDPIDEGGLSADGPINNINVMNRGTLHERRAGDQAPIALSFSVKYVSYRSESGETTSVADAVQQLGEAAAWKSARPAGEPYAFNVLARVYDAQKGEYEYLQYSECAITKKPLPAEGEEFSAIAVECEAFDPDVEAWWAAA